MKVGDLCIKLAGRDAGKRCVVLKTLENNQVLIDGETRRRPCNLAHLEPLHKSIDVKEDASHDDVVNVFKIELGVELKDSKPKEVKERPKKVHKVKEKPVKKVSVKTVKKTTKIETSEDKVKKESKAEVKKEVKEPKKEVKVEKPKVEAKVPDTAKETPVSE
jgi:large subunit ribosomal protein L14e